MQSVLWSPSWGLNPCSQAPWWSIDELIPHMPMWETWQQGADPPVGRATSSQKASNQRLM
jgi:hypothetical protein